MKYSVLMSVYYRESPCNLKASIDSIWAQTIPTDDFVLVSDGLLNEELDTVINDEQKKFGSALNVIRLKENQGLGNALKYGLEYCRHKLVARMDSDDLARENRCEKQLNLFNRDKNLAFCSGAVSEFETDSNIPTGKRVLPLNNEQIRKFSRRRNPMNHPCVMFKKSAVIDSGNYREKFHFFEDYDLWVRMLMKGYKAANLDDVLIDMRTPSDFYLRRGGREYAAELLNFHNWMKNEGWISESDYLTGAIPHAFVCLLPNKLRRLTYKILH